MPSNFYAVAKIDREYVIPFVGLKVGKHTFEFDITDAFFENVEYALIEKGNVQVTLTLEKKETMMIGGFAIKGEVELSCALCNDPVRVQIEGVYQLIYKFDNEPSDDETLIIVYPDEFELDLRENILELITVSLPSRAIHEDGGCNEEMMELLNEYRVNAEDADDTDDDAEASDGDSEEDPHEDDDIDPRWNALKNLKGDG